MGFHQTISFVSTKRLHSKRRAKSFQPENDAFNKFKEDAAGNGWLREQTHGHR